jgi:hypothetical protein
LPGDELQNLIERAVILSDYGVLPSPLPAEGTRRVNSFPAATTLRDSERALILRTLEAVGWVWGNCQKSNGICAVAIAEQVVESLSA